MSSALVAVAPCSTASNPPRLEQLRNAEIEQFRDAVRRHEDVRRLEIAVHDQVLMRVLHGVAHLEEQAQALLDRQPLLLAPRGDLHAGDVLENNVGRAVISGAAVEQSRDVGVLQVRENLPLATESRDRLVASRART